MPGLASRHRPADSRRRDQEVPDPAGRPVGFLLLEPHGPQAGVLRRGDWCRSRWCSICAADYFPGLARRRRRWLAFVASLVMAFLLGFFLEATIGMIGFWLLEVSSLLFVYMLFNFFFSGHMFPLDMLPRAVGHDWVRRAAAAASTWPISRRPCSWARSKAPSCVRGLCDRSWRGSCSSSSLMPRGVTTTRRYGGYSGFRRMTSQICTRCAVRASRLSSRVPHVRPQQPGARHDVSRELHHRVHLVAVVDGDEPGLLPADLSVHADRSAPTPAGASTSSSCSSPRRCSSTASCRRSSCPTPRSSAS